MTRKSDLKINGKVSKILVDEAIIIPFTLPKKSNDKKNDIPSSRKECLCKCLLANFTHSERKAASFPFKLIKNSPKCIVFGLIVNEKISLIR